ncbi:putative adenosylmethionine-8-amino-7-oxononanoate aminotransferase [Lophium mytilinum]|uniref:Putative adenosylmethionine-8-amino-7-oxononanoate aminotransferase n=1 Tax=Lophium mytilinum TaxID=390894 RepID=A0A6A6QNC7_9PEZI|nr:putative adenosylmethionine-8-amino-7-oxononanoate aminotransferase [Lophium mytilinum]
MAPSLLLETVSSNGDASAIAKSIVAEATPSTTMSPESRGQGRGLLHRSFTESPYEVSSALGSYLQLSTGVSILDGCGGAAVAIIGHGNEEVMAATVAQMQKVSYVHTLSYTTSSAEDLADLILEIPPGGFQHGLEKAYFCGSGSEANDAALKLARQYFYEKGEPQRKFYVSRSQSYHGNSIASMSVSANLPRKVPYQDILMHNVSFVSPAYSYQYQRSSETEQEYVVRLIAELDAEFQRIGPENVISFIAEPVVGATSGCVAAPKGYFAGVRKLCDKYGILLHLDEIMCGMGRTGTYFAFEQEDVLPDIVTVGKGLGGGYAPVAAVLISSKVVDTLRAGSAAFNHGQTYQAHPVTCATALAVQKIVRRESLVQRCALMGMLLNQLLVDTFGGCKFVGNIRGRGLFWALEFVRDKTTKETFSPSCHFGFNVQQNAFNLGLAVYPGAGTVDGVRGDHVIIAPPFTTSVVDLGKIVTLLKEAYIQEETRLDLS